MEAQDPLKWLWEIFAEIRKETKEKVGEEFYTWTNHYNTWIDIIDRSIEQAVKELEPGEEAEAEEAGEIEAE